MPEPLYDWLLFVHLVAAMVWVGGVAVLSGLATWVLRERDPEATTRFIRSLRVVGPVVLAPAPAVLVAAGTWMVLETDAWDFGQSWIQLALALFAGAFLIGVAHQSRAGIAADRAAARGDAGEARRQLVRWSWGTRVILALLLATAWVMVFKPGL
jgi:uncharacterized membrane protein